MSAKYLKKYTKRFYKMTVWVRKRVEILNRDNHECQRCKSYGKFSKGSVVHHIKHYQDRPDLALTDDNLITLCAACHNEVHPEKKLNKSKEPVHRELWE